MKRLAWAGITLAVAAGVAVLAVWLLRGGEGPTRAQSETVEMGIDPEVTGNTATTLGALEACVRLDVPAPAFDSVSDYNIDVYVRGDTEAPLAYDARVTYDASRVHIARPGTDTLVKMPGAANFSEALPDSDGTFVAATVYLTGGPGIGGDGTLVRLGLDIGGSGLLTFDLVPAPTSAYASAIDAPHPLATRTAHLAVNEDCPPGERGATAGPIPEERGTQAPPTPNPLLELERLRQEEAPKPKFEGVLNGIRLYPTDAEAAAQRKWACTGAGGQGVEHPPMSAVVGTPMEIVPTYLPPGAEETIPPAFPPVVCKGTVAYVERDWGIRGKGDFYIIRYQGERAIDVDAPAERLSAATVGGKPAVLVKPLVEGYDYSTVILAEDFGITVVAAFGLPLEETIKIAEGLK